jgi:CheY-like chemotaxis protein/HPt (histidine-containing phosphotransfer) domain-containing protein
MLERHGIEVTDAVNGQIGIDLATTHEYDVILMDMQMPIKDGYTAARELRTKGLTIPIVALTAHAMSGDAEKCRNAGCSDYLSKPIQENRLVNKLSELLHRRGDYNVSRFIESNETVDFDEKLNFAEICRPPVQRTTNVLEEHDDRCDISDQSLINIACALPLDDSIFREIVQEFSDKVQAQVERMKLAFAADDWRELVELAHWLKGSGGTAGYEQFTIPAGRLERLASQQKREKIEDVLREIDRIAKAVASEMSSLHAMC